MPNFCFQCGFIGHDADVCEKKVRGVQSVNYDVTLRCSPKRKYERGAVSATYNPATWRNLHFGSPLGSVSSSSLGKPSRGGYAPQERYHTEGLDIPEAVDTQDGFDGDGKRATE